MNSDQMIKHLGREVQAGPPLQSVVLQRMSHQGMHGYQLLVRKYHGANLETVCAWVASPDIDPGDIYDQVFDLTYECFAKLMDPEMRLFE